MHQPGRQEEGDQAERRRHREDGVDHMAGQLPGIDARLAGQQPAENRDEGVAQRPAADHDDQQLRDAVGRDVRVPAGIQPDLAGDDERLQQADRFGRAKGDHQQHGGTGQMSQGGMRRIVRRRVRLHAHRQTPGCKRSVKQKGTAATVPCVPSSLRPPGHLSWSLAVAPAPHGPGRNNGCAVAPG